jgi:hypothetical protein
VHSELRSRVPVPGGFGFPLGVALGVLVTFAAVATGATGHPERAVVGLAVAVALTATVTTAAATLGTALICWLLLAGFVTGREGQLGLTAQSGRAAVALAVTAIGCVVVVAAARRLWPRLIRVLIAPTTAPAPRATPVLVVDAGASRTRTRIRDVR